jgi:hypothetical protein
MSGYRGKQTVCIVVDLIGLWVGNFVWHALARSTAEEIVKNTAEEIVKNHKGETPAEGTLEYRQVVEETTKAVEEKWSAYTFDNLWGYLLIYGVAGALGIGAGAWVAEATGGETDK